MSRENAFRGLWDLEHRYARDEVDAAAASLIDAYEHGDGSLAPEDKEEIVRRLTKALKQWRNIGYSGNPGCRALGIIGLDPSLPHQMQQLILETLSEQAWGRDEAIQALSGFIRAENPGNDIKDEAFRTICKVATDPNARYSNRQTAAEELIKLEPLPPAALEAVVCAAELARDVQNIEHQVWSASFLNKLQCRGLYSGAKLAAEHHTEKGKIAKTFLHFAVATLLVLGPVEFALRWASSGYEDSTRAHFLIDNATHVATFMPLESSACALPPPQPILLMVAINGLKMAGMAYTMGTAPDFTKQDSRANVPKGKRVLYIAMTAYQWVMVPISMLSTLCAFANMGPFETSWQRYECFAIIWTLGPWWFNLLMMGVKTVMLRRVLEFAEQIDSRYDDHIPPGCIGERRQSSGDGTVSLKEVLLIDWRATLQAPELERRKLRSLWLTFAITTFPYLVIWAPVVLTHVFPALFFSMPEMVVLLGVIIAIYKLGSCGGVFPCGAYLAQLNAEKTRINFKTGELSHEYRYFDNSMVEADKKGALPLLPFIAGISISAELLVLQAVYSYTQLGGAAATMRLAWLLGVPPLVLGIGLIFMREFFRRAWCSSGEKCYYVCTALAGAIFLFVGTWQTFARPAYGNSILQAVSERHIDVYIKSFTAKVLGQFWAAMELLNEAI